jgi:hypothetical protein
MAISFWKGDRRTTPGTRKKSRIHSFRDFLLNSPALVGFFLAADFGFLKWRGIFHGALCRYFLTLFLIGCKISDPILTVLSMLAS